MGAGASHLDPELLTGRLARLRGVMAEQGIAALLTPDPIQIAYASGARNMTLFGMMGPTRFLMVHVDGPAVLYEFAGCEHLAAGLPTVDEIRPAPGINANAGPGYVGAAESFAAEIAWEVFRANGRGAILAVERLDFTMTDALRRHGSVLVDALPLLLESRRIKLPAELTVMGEAMTRVERGVAEMEGFIAAGSSEVEVWSEFHRSLIASEGEYISTRLLQGGRNTFPYFNEAGPSVLGPGDLLCLDTDAIGYGGYAVDFSRTFICGGRAPTVRQRELYAMAHEQLHHNADLLGPGVGFEEFARRAWTVPDEHRPYAYYCLAHGLGVSGEYPNVPVARPGEPYEFPGEFEPGMVMCVESYLGDERTGQGVKLEDQFLVTQNGTERMSTYPFDEALSGGL